MDHIHPEFGCFCPTPRFRRDVRLAFFAVIFGGLIGSVTVLALSTSDRNAETSTARVANPRVTQTETPKERLGGVEAPTRAAITRNYQVETSSRTPDPLPPPTVDSEMRQTNLNACEGSSLNAQDHCITEKPRPARSGAVNNAPEIARIPLGRPAALERATPIDAPTDSTSEDSELPTISQIVPAPATASQPLAAEDAARDHPHSTPGSRKKPHKIARAQNRHHSERSERVAAVRRGWDSGFGALGRAYARDTSYGPMGFWVWSW